MPDRFVSRDQNFHERLDEHVHIECLRSHPDADDVEALRVAAGKLFVFLSSYRLCYFRYKLQGSIPFPSRSLNSGVQVQGGKGTIRFPQSLGKLWGIFRPLCLIYHALGVF